MHACLHTLSTCNTVHVCAPFLSCIRILSHKASMNAYFTQQNQHIHINTHTHTCMHACLHTLSTCNTVHVCAPFLSCIRILSHRATMCARANTAELTIFSFSLSNSADMYSAYVCMCIFMFVCVCVRANTAEPPTFSFSLSNSADMYSAYVCACMFMCVYVCLQC